jgi:hypothetical protein
VSNSPDTLHGVCPWRMNSERAILLLSRWRDGSHANAALSSPPQACATPVYSRGQIFHGPDTKPALRDGLASPWTRDNQPRHQTARTVRRLAESTRASTTSTDPVRLTLLGRRPDPDDHGAHSASTSPSNADSPQAARHHSGGRGCGGGAVWIRAVDSSGVKHCPGGCQDASSGGVDQLLCSDRPRLFRRLVTQRG